MIFLPLNIVLISPDIGIFGLLARLVVLSVIIYIFYKFLTRHSLRKKDIPLSNKQQNYLKEVRQQHIKHNKEYEHEKINAERLSQWREKQEKFYRSSEYKFVKQFVKKYENKENNQDFLKLQMLLENSEWEFTADELKIIVNEENKRQRIENSKFKILINKPNGRQEILESYLDFYGSNDNETLEGLAETLQERHLYFESLDKLKNELKNVERRVELKIFEKRLFEESEQNYLEKIDQLNGYEFEDFLKNLFSKMGYQVEQTRLSGDQGADLVVIKFGEKTVIQAKRFGGKVGNRAVQEIMAAISLYKAQKGMVITNNYFTPAAVELANPNNIELIDRDALEELINKYW